jgi:hypothetical protein
MKAVTPENPIWSSEGQRLFDAYLTKHRITNVEAGAALGITKSAVAHLREGASPKPGRRLAIERWTDGEVPVASWVTIEERESAAKVVPFKEARAARSAIPQETAQAA